MPTAVTTVDTAPGRRRIPVQTWAAVVAFTALWIALGSLIVPTARHHDFLNLYTGGSLALQSNFHHLHSPATQLDLERKLVPGMPVLVPFVRPAFYALLLSPLGLVPFGTAFWIWISLQSALLLACWAWAFLRWGSDALIFGALYLPTALGIASGQDCVVMLAILIATYWLAERGEDFGAGAALGLGLMKFHLFLLWPVALVIQERWRMLIGASTAVLIESLISLRLSGSSGVVAYFQLLTDKNIERLNPSPELTVDVHGLAINLGVNNLPFRVSLVALVVVLVALACWRAPLWQWLSACSVGSLLVAPHVYGYDAALLLLPIWLTIFRSTDRWQRVAGTTVCTPIPFLMTLAGSPWAGATPVALLLFLISLTRNSGSERCASVGIPHQSREVAHIAEPHPLV